MYFKKNNYKFKNNELKKYINEFYSLYKRRPIKYNKGGMYFGNMFGLFCLLKKIKPKHVIESGVYKGQTSWLIENVLPKTKILSIDPDLSKRIYISKKIKYSTVDFKYQNFTNIPKDTLVFFDDHQNQIDRLIQAKWIGIKYVVFDDNYAVGEGDFYTLKHAYHQKGYSHPLTIRNMIKSSLIFFIMMFKKKFFNNYYFSTDVLKSRFRDQLPNKFDFFNVKKNIQIYLEFPPIFKNKKQNSIKSILSNNDKKKFDLSDRELTSHSSVTFIKLK